MKFVEVVSGALSSVGYDEETNTLGVVFKDKTVYFYQGVPQVKYDSLLAAESKGGYLSEEIRKDHPCFKLEGVELLPAGANSALSTMLMNAP